MRLLQLVFPRQYLVIESNPGIERMPGAEFYRYLRRFTHNSVSEMRVLSRNSPNPDEKSLDGGGLEVALFVSEMKLKTNFIF
jgi:hypothetical protein